MNVDQPDDKIQSDRRDEGLYDFSYDDDDGGNIKSPDGAIDDESNMSALDLYTDMVVRDSEEAALSMAKLKEEKSSFKTQLDAALIEVSKLTTVNETLTKENRVLKSNISVLLKTAKMEIQRKERELNELREMQLDGRRPSANSYSSRSRKTRRGPKQRQQPGPPRQNGAQHPKGPNAGPTPKAMNRTGDSDSDKEQKPDVRETMFVRRQRAKNQQQSTSATSQLSSDKPESGGAKRSIGDTLLHLSRQSSHQIETLRFETKEKDKDGPLMKGSDETPLQRTMEPNTADTIRRSEPKFLGTQKPAVVITAVPRVEAQREKTNERFSHHLKDRSRSRSVERATRSRSGERSSTKICDDRSQQDQRKVQPRSGSRERSSTSKSDDKRLSPSRSSRSRSNEKRSSRSKSRDKMSHERRSSRSKSRDRDRSKQDQRKVQPRSGSRERSSKSRSDDKRLSPSRSSRSRSNDKRSSRSKSRDRMLFGSKSSRRSSRSKSRDRDRPKQDQRKVQPRSGSRERSPTSKSDDKRLSPSRSSRSKSNDKMLLGSRSPSSISHERRSSRSKSRDRVPHSHYRNKPNDLKQRKEEVSQRKSSSTSKSSRSARDARDKQAESLAFSRSRTPREIVSKDRRRDRDRRESRRSSTPIRDSTRKDSERSKENRKTSSSVKRPSSRERGQSRARDRMSSIAKESVAKAKAMLNKRTSGYSSPKKSHRYDRRRSSKDLCLDGLTEWTKAESSHINTHPGEVRKKERGHEGIERKRKHRLSSSFQKESLSHAKKWKAGSNSDDTGKVDVADENRLDAVATNPCTYEEGHTVLACGIRDSIECTSSKVTVLHTSVSDAYDTTQSDTSFLHASGLQVDNGVLKLSTDVAGSCLNKEIREERELSEGEIISDDEEASKTKKSKQRSSEKKKKRLSKHRHSHHHSKSPESTTHFLKPPRRGKKQKRRRSSDQEAQERKKRPKENMKSDDSIQLQTEEDESAQKSKACEGSLVEELVSENAFPRKTCLDDSEIAPGHPDDDVDKEKDVSEFTETSVDNRPTPISESEAVDMMHVSESALGACGDIEEVPKTETLGSPVEEGEHEKDESRGERILKFEDAVVSETIGPNLSTEALSEQAVSTPIKESVCAGEMQARQGATEADANVSRGILFEDLCLSSSMDDTSYLSCVNTTSENQRHSFMNSIENEKVDNLVKEISDPLVNISAPDMDESQKLIEGHEKLETGISESLGTSALDLHHIPPKTITSVPMSDPSENVEGFSEFRVKDASPDQMVTDGTHLETSPDTSAELNTSKSSEPAHDDIVLSCEKDVLVLNDDKSESDDHVADEDNDAVSLLAASGYLDSFVHDNAPKVKRDFDLSFNESRGVLKETETVDKTETSLRLTCEWSNIEFQDSSTKMGAEPDQGPVTINAPFLDDGCAQDMEYVTNPVLDEEEHEKNDETFKDDKEKKIDFGRTIGDNIKEKEKSQTYMSKEASEPRPSKRDPLNLDNMDTGVRDALATEEAGVNTDRHQSCEVKVSGASYSTEEDLFPNRVMDEEKEIEKENLDEGTLAHQREDKDEAHVSCNPIVIDDDEVESELDFEEDEEEEEEQEDSVYIVDVQPAKSCQRKQEDDSCQESEEESQSESDTSDLESKHEHLKTGVSRDEPLAVGEREGHNKPISDKGLLESNEVESDLDWESEPEDQNEEEDVSEVIEKGIDRDYKKNEKLDSKEEEEEKTNGDQQKCAEDSEEEGEILEEEEGEEEHVQDSDGRHNRKQPSKKLGTDQRHRRDDKGHSHRDLQRSVHRDSSSGKRERSSDFHRLDVKGKGERGRSGSSDQDPRSHREVQERDNRKHPKREDRERTGKGRINEERSRRMKEDRREASERRKEEDRKKALERKREEDRRRLDRRKEDERREARRRLEEERRQHEEKKRARTREENKKVRSRLHESEKKREPPRKSKKVSESRKS